MAGDEFSKLKVLGLVCTRSPPFLLVTGANLILIHDKLILTLKKDDVYRLNETNIIKGDNTILVRYL